MRKVKIMVKRILIFFYFIYEVVMLAAVRGKVVPVRFFNARPNVGDALNIYIIQKISGRKIFEVKSGMLQHVLGIGSIMHLGTANSVAWGTGIIESKRIPNNSTLKKMSFSAVRGKKTKDIIGEVIGGKLTCPMGDPAVLMPLFYTPKNKKYYSIGIVPHYVDKETEAFKNFLLKSKAKLIDVELPVEDFLDSLAECDVILSSSLHGLILSDSYNIPNVWVRFSDEVIGGDFKFLDYYSTTDLKEASPIDLREKECDANIIKDLLSRAKVAKFTEDKGILLDAFPSRL
ncbi:polysaccharide pyruvyl transferase family protein [Oceanisphaera ostreae]|uniref:Polysaccharide pyruvyl transferase family protein n=1 Tax=Oceanisphaera ostreae TaxID=914151 RepID=A0ABW3KED1_9GAMM